MFNAQSTTTYVKVNGNCVPLPELSPAAIEKVARDNGIGAFNLVDGQGREVAANSLGSYSGQTLKIVAVNKAQ